MSRFKMKFLFATATILGFFGLFCEGVKRNSIVVQEFNEALTGELLTLLNRTLPAALSKELFTTLSQKLPQTITQQLPDVLSKHLSVETVQMISNVFRTGPTQPEIVSLVCPTSQQVSMAVTQMVLHALDARFTNEIAHRESQMVSAIVAQRLAHVLAQTLMLHRELASTVANIPEKSASGIIQKAVKAVSQGAEAFLVNQIAQIVASEVAQVSTDLASSGLAPYLAKRLSTLLAPAMTDQIVTVIVEQASGILRFNDAQIGALINEWTEKILQIFSQFHVKTSAETAIVYLGSVAGEEIQMMTTFAEVQHELVRLLAQRITKEIKTSLVKEKARTGITSMLPFPFTEIENRLMARQSMFPRPFVRVVSGIAQRFNKNFRYIADTVMHIKSKPTHQEVAHKKGYRW